MIVFTSASTVRGFRKMMADADISRLQAVCIGAQTKEAAEKLDLPMSVWQQKRLWMPLFQ